MAVSPRDNQVRTTFIEVEMPRAPITEQVSVEVALKGRRRCVLCFGLNADQAVKAGQLAHVERDSSRSGVDDLAWLCLPHHDEYDSKRSQSRGFSPKELRAYRDELYDLIASSRATMAIGRAHPPFTPDAFRIAAHFAARSIDGRQWDPQIPISVVATDLEMTVDEARIAIEDLQELRLLDTDGSMSMAFPQDRLFWELDPLVGVGDPLRDAVDVARFVIAHDDDFVDLAEIGSALDWGPRRTNPAVTFLVAHGVVEPRAAMGSAPWALLSVIRTPSTRRFVREAV
ncbi:MAG: hypothetical protein SFU84_14630 [Gemmatimonadales bacterium]|nr:hypothetical protein [Gemmatimonadales bacterium]